MKTLLIWLMLAGFAFGQIYETNTLRGGSVSVNAVPDWGQSTAYVADQLVVYNGVLYRRTTAGTSTTSFDSTKWISLASDDTRDDLSEIQARETSPSSGTGSYTRVTPTTGDSFVHEYEDGSATVTTEWTPPLTNLAAVSGNVWAIHLEVEAETVANHVISVGYEDGSNSATCQIELGTSDVGSVVSTNSSGNCAMSGTYLHARRAVGGVTVIPVTLVVTWTGTSGADPHLLIQPAFNLDGTSTEDVAATGDVRVRKIELGAQLEFLHTYSTSGVRLPEVYVDGKVVVEKVFSLAGLADGSELIAAGEAENIVDFGGELLDSSDRGYPLPYSYGSDSACLIRTAGDAIQLKASGACYPDATNGGYVWIRYTASDAVFGALTISNADIDFGAGAYVVDDFTGEAFSGSWEDADASPSNPVSEIYLTLNGQEVTLDGDLVTSDLGLVTGTWSFDSGFLDLAVDGATLTASIVDGDGLTGVDTATLSHNYWDPLRELSGHPKQDATSASWNNPPQWYSDTSDSLAALGRGYKTESTTGYGGAAGVAGSNSKADFQYAATAAYQRIKLAVAVPDGSVFNWELFVNGASVATGSVAGEVIFTGKPNETTVDIGERMVTVGHVVKLQCWTTVGGGLPSGTDEYAVWQHTQIVESASAETFDSGNYFVDSVDGNNGSGVAGDPDQPWATLEYLLNNVAIPNGTANDPTIIWVERGHSETLTAGEKPLLWLIDKEYVQIKPYGSGPLPLVDANHAQPDSSFYYPTPGGPTGPRGVVELKNCVSCGVEGIRVQESNQTGIVIRNTSDPSLSRSSTDCYVRFCRTDDTYSDGIIAEASNVDSYPGTPTKVLRPLVQFNWITNANSALNDVGGRTTGQSLTFANTTDGEIRGNFVDLMWKEGIDVIDSSGFTIADNWVAGRSPTTTYNSTVGIYLDGTSDEVEDGIIENNVVGGGATRVKNGIVIGAERGGLVEDITVRNNLVFGVGQAGIAFTDEQSGATFNRVLVYSNTFSSGGAAEYVVNKTAAGTVFNSEFKYNSVNRPTGASLQLLNGMDAFEISKNHFHNGVMSISGTTGSSPIVADPDFTTKTSAAFPWSIDYYPSASSPLLQAASGRPVTRDLFRVRRSGTQDVGALER